MLIRELTHGNIVSVTLSTADISSIQNLLRPLSDSISHLEVTVSQLDLKVSQLDVKVSQLDDKVSQLDRKVSQLDDRVSHLADKVSQLDVKMSQLDKRVKRIEGTMIDRFNIVDQNFGALFKRDEIYQQEFLIINAQLSRLEKCAWKWYRS